MRRKSICITVAAVVALSLAGCHREDSLTGPSLGTGVLSGQVVPVGDLSGASPAGISVTCSGQVALTDGSGMFSFTGLSASRQYTAFATGMQMSFSRKYGINASANVSSDASTVVVQLQKSQATVVVTGQSKRELEGLITAISSSSITVSDASTGGPVTAEITSSTTIRKGNQTLKASDLKVGDRVHIKASVGSGNSLTAFEIMLQESGTDDGGSDSGQTKELEGLITAVSASSITVNNASTGGPVTAAITSDTVIRKGNTRLKASDLKVGDRVHVKTTGSGDALTATEIIRQNPGD